jgi:hypothetical protein
MCTWFRGESTNAPPARAGGHIHDFGDGVYFTDSQAVAEQYARTRVAGSGGSHQVFQVTIRRAELGRVLDLSNDPRWRQYLRTPSIPGRPDMTPEALIRQANENYGRFFQAFLQQNRLRTADYDAVIGPEFVRGGKQLAILHRNQQPSAIAGQIRARMQLVGGGTTGSSPAAPPVRPVLPPSGRGVGGASRGVISNQAAMAIVGQALGAGIQALGDIGIRRRIRQELETTHAQAIASILSRGEGVLIIIRLQEWATPDFNGNRARGLLSVLVESGPTQQETLARWRRTPKYLQDAPRGWRVMPESYCWIPPRH